MLQDQLTLESECRKVILLGFNSGRYDINLIKKELISVLMATDKEVKTIRNPSYMAITTSSLKILDISNYLPAGTSYASYLETYLGKCECEDKIRCVCGLGKGLFPYEYITQFDKLNETEIPPISAFDSTLRNSKISEDDYERVKFVWNHYQMKSVKDLLVWYNNLDVKPFVSAVIKQRELYKRFGLDMLSDGVSLPSLAEKIMYQTLYNNLESIKPKFGEPFSFPQARMSGYRKQDADAKREFKMSIEHLNKQLKKQRFSCCYCKCALNEENVSADRKNNTKGHVDGNIVMSCVSCNVARKKMSMTAFSNQKKLEYNADRVVWSIDEDNKDIYYKMKANIAGGPSIIFNRYAKTDETYIRNGSKHVKKIIGYDANALYRWALGNEMPCGRLCAIEPYEGIVDDIKAGSIFGFLECDIETPPHLKQYFSEMTPIFKNAEIDPMDKDLVGEHMYEYNILGNSRAR